MSKARELAELGSVYDSGALSNRNKIINGAFQVWQRGTSQTGSNSYGSVDRWVLYTSGNGLTAAQSNDVPSGSGLTYSIATTGTPSGEYILAQGIELTKTGYAGEFYNGQKITISYYAKSSVAGDKLRHFIGFRNTTTSSTNQSIIENNTNQNDLTTSYQKFSKTYTISVDPNSTNTVLCVMIRTRNAANDSSTAAGNITIAGVQLEFGTEATPFEHRSFGDELARCQRYYYRHVNGDNQFIGGGDMYTTSQLNANIDFPTAMRAFPSLVAASGTNYYIAYGAGTSTDVTNSWNLFKEHTNAATIYVTPTSTVTAGSGMRVITSSASGSIAFDAEL